MGDNLTPVLAYYEHPKLSDSVPKGVMFLDERGLPSQSSRAETSSSCSASFAASLLGNHRRRC
jgi:hypothetical protein